MKKMSFIGLAILFIFTIGTISFAREQDEECQVHWSNWDGTRFNDYPEWTTEEGCPSPEEYGTIFTDDLISFFPTDQGWGLPSVLVNTVGTVATTIVFDPMRSAGDSLNSAICDSFLVHTFTELCSEEYVYSVSYAYEPYFEWHPNAFGFGDSYWGRGRCSFTTPMYAFLAKTDHPDSGVIYYGFKNDGQYNPCIDPGVPSQWDDITIEFRYYRVRGISILFPMGLWMTPLTDEQMAEIHGDLS